MLCSAISMRVCRVGLPLSLILVVLQSLSVTGRKAAFRSGKAPAETIINYEIVKPVLTSSDSGKDGYPKRMTVNTVRPEFVLQLELNENLLPPHFTSRYYDEHGNEIIQKGHVNCFYQGRVEGHPDWRVTMSTCHGFQGSFGDLGDEQHYYHIEPLDHHLTTLDQPHALYLATEYQQKNRSCGSNHHPSNSGKINDFLSPFADQVRKERLKRQTRNGFLIVEWAVVNDMAQFESYGMNLTATVLRSLEIANFVDSLYQTLNVRVVLVDVTTWTNGDRITVTPNSNQLLDNFEVYRPQITALHDSAMLITGIDLDGNTVGIAFIGTMCNDRSSVGVSQDGRGGGVESVGSTAAHELGHIFNMNHDDEGRTCSCTDPSGDCIMSSVSGFPPPTEWSDCSRSDIQQGFNNRDLDRCLTNEPTMTVGDPVCGNGIRERDEICDCGSVEECLDPCCNATTCELAEGAQCFAGDCCDSNCRFVPYGTTCRETTQECDILEYCSGESSECPTDLHLQDGHDCNNNQSYCFSGACVTYDRQCELHFQAGTRSVEECFTTFNVRGNDFGNCGYSGGQFVGCAVQDALCGQLHCDSNPQLFVNNANRAVTIITNRVGGNPCISFTTRPSSDTPSPGLVADGSRCENDMICFSQSCIPVTELNGIEACPVGTDGMLCSGNGQCNNRNLCSCDVGFDGNACQSVYTGPKSSSGVNGGAIAGGVIGALLGIAVIAGVAVGVAFLIVKYKGKRKFYSAPAYPHHSTKRTSPGLHSNHGNTSVDIRPSYKGYTPPSITAPAKQPTRPAPANPPSKPSPVNGYRQPPPKPFKPNMPKSSLQPSRLPPKPNKPVPAAPNKPCPAPPATSVQPRPDNVGKVHRQWPPPPTNNTSVNKPVLPPKKPRVPPRS